MPGLSTTISAFRLSPSVVPEETELLEEDSDELELVVEEELLPETEEELLLELPLLLEEIELVFTDELELLLFS